MVSIPTCFSFNNGVLLHGCMTSMSHNTLVGLLQGQWKVLYSTSEGLISDSGKPFAQPAHLAFNQSALIFEFKPPESRGFLSINRGGRFVSDLVRLDDMSYEVRTH